MEGESLMKNQKILLASLLIPFFILLGLVLKTEFDIRIGERILVEVEGYDPRDILRGRYIVFRYKWDFDQNKTKAYQERNENSTKRQSTRDDYLCLMANKKVYPIKEDEDQHLCRHIVRGDFYEGFNQRPEFSLGLEKFYVPEKYASMIEKKFMQKSGKIAIVINGQKRAVLLDLIIDGKSWKEMTKE